MRLVRLEFLVIRVLDVDGPAPQLGDAAAEVIDHRSGRRFVAHLQEGLVFTLEHQHVGDPPEGNAQVDDFGLRDVIWNVSDMDDARRLAYVLF